MSYKKYKKRFNGATSDHAALFINFKLSSIPLLKKRNEEDNNPWPPVQKINNKVLRGRELPTFEKKVEEYFSNLSQDNANLLSPSELLDDFESHIVQAAANVASTETKRRPDWFTEAEQLLLKLIQQRNNAFKICMKNLSKENQAKLKIGRHNLKNDFNIRPKEAWEMVFKLMERFQKHH